MHTPGPWKIEDGEPNSQIVYIVESDGESTIGEIDLSGDGIDEETGMANARLIAAAPELLTLLEESLVYVEECESFHKESCRTLSKRIRDAIHAATH